MHIMHNDIVNPMLHTNCHTKCMTIMHASVVTSRAMHSCENIIRQSSPLAPLRWVTIYFTFIISTGKKLTVKPFSPTCSPA